MTWWLPRPVSKATCLRATSGTARETSESDSYSGGGGSSVRSRSPSVGPARPRAGQGRQGVDADWGQNRVTVTDGTDGTALADAFRPSVLHRDSNSGCSDEICGQTTPARISLWPSLWILDASQGKTEA